LNSVDKYKHRLQNNKKMYSSLKNIIPSTLKRKIKLSIRTFLQSLVYFLIRNRIDTRHVNHIIFVCKGNICRSSFAEFYLKSKKLGRDWIIESCGLDVDQGVNSPSNALSVAEEFGVDLSSNKSKSLSVTNIDNSDLIVAMEYVHFNTLLAKFPRKKNQIVLLRDFAPWPESLACNIDDPYGCGLDEFRACFTTMKCALDRLAGQLAQNHRR